MQLNCLNAATTEAPVITTVAIEPQTTIARKYAKP